MMIDILVQLEIAGLDPDHPAHEAAVDEFMTDAREATELEVSERNAASRGTKGGVLQDLVLTVAAAPSSAVAVVQLFKLWLRRDRHRSIKVTIRQKGKKPVTVEASGDNLSLDAFAKIVNEALEK